MKDHEIKEFVNELTSIAKCYEGMGQLKERLNRVVLKHVRPEPYHSNQKIKKGK